MKMAYEAGQSGEPIARRSEEGRAMRVLVPVALVIGTIALVAAIVGLVMDHPKSYTSQLQKIRNHESVLTSRLNAANAEIAQLKANSQVGTVTKLSSSFSTTSSEVSSLKSELAQYKICVPQLQQEITSLNIQSSTQGGFLTSAYIQDPTIVSSNCAGLLNGASH
jgi:hypothetical protein